MSKTKATEAALFIGENEEILFLAFLGRLFRLCRWSFLLVWCRIELVCDEDDAVVLGALLINPLVWLEVALDCEHGSLLQLCWNISMNILNTQRYSLWRKVSKSCVPRTNRYQAFGMDIF